MASSKTLTGNASINGSTCFTITAANVTLNCNGNTITGNNTSTTYGVYSTQLNTTVQNCIISNFTAAIYYNVSNNGTIYNNTLKLNQYGIYLSNSSYSNASSNNMTSNSVSGVTLDSASASNSLYNDTACSNTIDVNNSNSSNSGSTDRCDKFLLLERSRPLRLHLLLQLALAEDIREPHRDRGAWRQQRLALCLQLDKLGGRGERLCGILQLLAELAAAAGNRQEHHQRHHHERFLQAGQRAWYGRLR